MHSHHVQSYSTALEVYDQFVAERRVSVSDEAVFKSEKAKSGTSPSKKSVVPYCRVLFTELTRLSQTNPLVCLSVCLFSCVSVYICLFVCGCPVCVCLSVVAFVCLMLVYACKHAYMHQHA